MTRLRASPRRFKAGSKRRGTRITFRLTDPARVVFVVRGPAPSCQVVGRFSVRGRAGLNRIRFKGRVGRQTLGPGTYSITAHPAGNEQQARRIVVIIGTKARAALDCATATEFSFAAGLPSFVPPTVGPTARPKRPRPQPAAKEEDRTRGVLPAIRRKLREIPEAIPIPRPQVPHEAADSPPAILGLVALGLLALSALAILVYVIYFLRGPGTKSA